MNAFATFINTILNRRNNAFEARQLLERATEARGISPADAAGLRANAMAVLRVVR
jgi:hypothetical protein